MRYPAEDMVVTHSEDAGDGTVPFWSALPRPVQKQVVVNEHAQVFRGLPFMRVFLPAARRRPWARLEAAGLAKATEPIRHSIPTRITRCGREFELLVMPAEAEANLTGVLTLQRLKEDGTPAAVAEAMSNVTYQGPPLSRLRLTMPPVANPGLYEIAFAGVPAGSQPLRFAVASVSA